MAARRPSAAQVRDRRSRIILMAAGAVFLILAVVQGPKIMKMFKGGSSPEAAAPATPAATADGATSADAPVTAVSFTSGPATGQLRSFTLLAPKDPFHSQDVQEPAPVEVAVTAAVVEKAPAEPIVKKAATDVPDAVVPDTTGPGAVDPGTTDSGTAGSGAAGSGTAGSGAAGSGAAETVIEPPAPTGVLAAVMKMNGNEQTVPKGGQFPLASPLFEIVSVGKKHASIGLVTGSFADGSRTLKLKQGHKLTLVNQTDGSRYVLVYVEQTRSAESPTAPTATPTG